MSMKVILKDNKMFIAIGRSRMKMERGLRNGLHEGGLIAKREAARLITEPPKTGIIYTIGGRRHQSSDEGEAPATFSGQLARSLNIKTISATQLIFSDKAPYSGYLEEGTVKMKPRPFLKTAAENTARDMVNALLKHTERELGTA